MSYCTVAEVKARETVAGVTDAEYTRAIAWAQALIDKVTFDHFEPTTLTLLISGSGTYRQNLYPWTVLRCLSVTSITDVPSGDTVAADEFTIEDRFLVLLEEYTVRAGATNTIWPKGVYNLRIIGSFGWSAVPVLIKDAAILLTLNKVKNPASSALGTAKKSERIGDYAYTTDTSEISRTGVREVDEVLEFYMNNFIGVEAV